MDWNIPDNRNDKRIIDIFKRDGKPTIKNTFISWLPPIFAEGELNSLIKIVNLE